MHSAIYAGAVSHDRAGPRRHAFRKRLFMLYLDLDELSVVFRRRWLWSIERPNVCSFRRADYLGPRDRPLKAAVLDRVERQLGSRPQGAVRMLTHVRSFGYVFNPVTFYYCFGLDERLEAVVAEITNTPWGERHAYVLGASANGDARMRFRKAFHVSPFHGMDQEYDWRITAPAERLSVAMTNFAGEEAVFHAALECERKPITGVSLARALLRHPFQAFAVHAAIYWHAARLWLKRTPFHEHPGTRTT